MIQSEWFWLVFWHNENSAENAKLRGDSFKFLQNKIILSCHMCNVLYMMDAIYPAAKPSCVEISCKQQSSEKPINTASETANLGSINNLLNEYLIYGVSKTRTGANTNFLPIQNSPSGSPNPSV